MLTNKVKIGKAEIINRDLRRLRDRWSAIQADGDTGMRGILTFIGEVFGGRVPKNDWQFARCRERNEQTA